MSDLISRQAAIVQLSHNKTGDDDCDVVVQNDIETIKALPSAEPKLEQITPSEQGESDKLGVKSGKTCTDLIYRQKAIEALNKDIMGGLNYKSILSRLPSAESERKKGKWIDAIIPNENGGLQVQVCNQCNTFFPLAYTGGGHSFCPNCGSYNGGEEGDAT